jgi:hypothetical protein
VAFATDGVRQGGWAAINPPVGEIHAALWHGTATTFRDMNPGGARQSVIRGMADGVQVGEALFGTQHHAVVWHGTPASFIDVHPAGAQNSFLYDTTGTIHAGSAMYNGNAQAGIWIGDDPDSFLSLHQYLGPGWWASAAYTLTVHEGRLYVGGAAACSSSSEAVLWISPPLCLGDLDADGDVDLADLAALLANYGQTQAAGWTDGDIEGDDGDGQPGDGDVDLRDLALLLSHFGTSCR